MKTLMSLMGNPHKKLRYVHVAGTNGKGSTVAFISEILLKSGYKVGTFISPYIERFSERIKVNNTEIANDDIARITEFVKKNVNIMLAEGKGNPTEFEIVTAIAFQYFCEMNCDVVVLEVGLGGRFDSTNIIDSPMLSVITTISYDHTDILGNTLSKIAYEKAGIIKKYSDVLLYPQEAEAEKVIFETCTSLSARLVKADFSGIKITEENLKGQSFNYKKNYSNLKISLLGTYQIRNAVMAILACEILGKKGLKIPQSAIKEGLADTKWPGRFEIIHEKPMFIIDGAHNPEGVEAFTENIKMYFPGKKVTFILGVLRDKDYISIIETLAPLAEGFISVTPLSNRSVSADELGRIVNKYCNNTIVSDTINEAVETALTQAKPNDIICALGSLYYIGEIRKIMFAAG
jgi:dihydrofolate synthase/folylpolyglutamate synthase